MATANLSDGLGGTLLDVQLPTAPGRAAAAASRPVALSTEDLTAINAITTKLTADPATQTTLAAILAKIIAAPATEASLASAVTALQLLDNAIAGAEMQVDVVAALPTGTNTVGKVEHTTTGIGHGVKTITTAGTDLVLTTTTPAKWVTIQSQTDNVGFIAVGATGVDATVATGTGVLLAVGESITLPCDNLADIFIDATISGEGVRYTYGT